MTCENCGVRPAAVFLQQRKDGQETTLSVCNHCASALGVGSTGAQASYGTLESLLEQLMGPRPRRDNLLAQLSEMAQQVIEKAARLALDWGNERILPEFVLLSLLQSVPEIREALHKAGAPVDEYEARLEQVVGRQPPRLTEGVALSAAVKKVLQIARFQSLQLGHNFIGPEHLMLGIILEGESFASQFLGKLDLEKLRHDFAGTQPGAVAPVPAAEKLPPHLTRFTRDITTLAHAGELDPVIGREREIDRVIRIISRKTKNNPVLIGEPGVGKTAIAEGLAQRIVSGTVPEALKDKRVLALDLGSVLAGTKFRGEFEDRVNNLLKELRGARSRYILFVDEVHTLIGAGAGEGSMDASNLLKPALARGELQCLGATTLDEYRKYIEKDAALERRFQPVLVSEPSPEQAIEILRGLRDSYEAHHRVKITDQAITAAVELADRYISDRFLPDKAIDLLDEAAAMARLGAQIEPFQVKELEDRLEKLEKEKNASVASEHYGDAAKLKGDLESLRAEVEGLKRHWQEQRGTVEPSVTPDTIASVVAEWTGIPAKRLQMEESERLLEMERHLAQRVVGQEEAIRAVSEAVRRARTGLKDPNRPIGSFIFLGPTGVGKTETARALADYLFNDERAMIRFDMSEYMERHTVSRLIGAPPGYVGYEESGKLTELVRRRPYSVVLFDEIEKAHPDVFNLLLQLLDDGRLTDAKGRTVDFKNTVILMTSNVGAQHLTFRGALGFQTAGEEEAKRSVRDSVMAAMREQFRPEFLNRIDEIIVFQPLNQAQLSGIVDMMLEATRRKLRGQNLSLFLTEPAKQALVERGFDARYGARPLRRAIQREVETPLSRMLLRGEAREGDILYVDFADGHFTFASERPSYEVRAQ